MYRNNSIDCERSESRYLVLTREEEPTAPTTVINET